VRFDLVGARRSRRIYCASPFRLSQNEISASMSWRVRSLARLSPPRSPLPADMRRAVPSACVNPKVKAEYDALAPEFEISAELVKARLRPGLSQAELAVRMGTGQSTIA
jgi:hypothetical protein